MTDIFEQRCPLCRGNAKYQFKNFFRLKHFKCGTCNEYVISIDVERDLSNHIPQCRTELSVKAKFSDEEKILVITLPPIASKRDGFAYPTFNEEFVERKVLLS
ncbi:MAG: hypothetical protein PHQ60_04675 [Sideroxydans sp.]|nr:hypothetical protein [Sideroxydans sp.]